MWRAAFISAVLHALAVALIDVGPPRSEPRYTPPVINVDMALLDAVDEAVFDPWIETGAATLQLGADEQYAAPQERPFHSDGDLDGVRRGASEWHSGPVQSPGASGSSNLQRRNTSPGQHARRIRRLKANSSLKTSETLYLNRWQRKVESVATLYFGPELAGRAGHITVMVVLDPTGRVEGIRLIEPSEDEQLNRAVINILKAASPFPPFPPELADQADLIEVIRVWRFGTSDGHLSTGAAPPAPSP